jgi:hypothetical protein
VLCEEGINLHQRKPHLPEAASDSSGGKRCRAARQVNAGPLRTRRGTGWHRGPRESWKPFYHGIFLLMAPRAARARAEQQFSNFPSECPLTRDCSIITWSGTKFWQWRWTELGLFQSEQSNEYFLHHRRSGRNHCGRRISWTACLTNRLRRVMRTFSPADGAKLCIERVMHSRRQPAPKYRSTKPHHAIKPPKSVTWDFSGSAALAPSRTPRAKSRATSNFL